MIEQYGGLQQFQSLLLLEVQSIEDEMGSDILAWLVASGFEPYENFTWQHLGCELRKLFSERKRPVYRERQFYAVLAAAAYFVLRGFQRDQHQTLHDIVRELEYAELAEMESDVVLGMTIADAAAHAACAAASAAFRYAAQARKAARDAEEAANTADAAKNAAATACILLLKKQAICCEYCCILSVMTIMITKHDQNRRYIIYLRHIEYEYCNA